MNNFTKLQELLSEFTTNEVEIKPDSILVQDLGLNSFELAQLIENVEDTFDIEVKDSDIGRFQTVQNIIDYIEAQQ